MLLEVTKVSLMLIDLQGLVGTILMTKNTLKSIQTQYEFLAPVLSV